MFEVVVHRLKSFERAVVFAVLVGSVFLSPLKSTAAVTVAWDPNPEPDITNYQVYYGVVDSGTTNIVSAGTNTEQPISGLFPGTDYWFYVTAVNAVGLESDPSTVLLHTTDTPSVAPSITSSSLPNTARVGTPYSFNVTATGSPTISFSAVGLPPGVAISGTGTITGTPTVPGVFNGTITAASGIEPRATQAFSITVSEPLRAPTITSSPAPGAATVGAAYAHTVSATGSAQIIFSATGLPAGVSIASSGTISGTPTTPGVFNGTITAANGTPPNAVQPFSIIVSDVETAPTITSSSLPNTAAVGTPYSYSVTATGSATISFSAFGLPPGLTISSTGNVSGTPSSSGAFSGVITASNGTQPNASQPFSIVVDPAPEPPVITSVVPPSEATVGAPYTHIVTASGSASILFSATGLPPGIAVSQSGAISGTPTIAGTFNGTITASNAADIDATQAFSIVVKIAPSITSSLPPSDATIGKFYSHPVTATGTAPIAFDAIGLPPGFSISSGGIISGSPTVTGTFEGVVTASNGASPNATQAFSITVHPAPVAPIITSDATPTTATVGSLFTHTVTASGTGPITFAATGLPAGISISPQGLISGTPTTPGVFNGNITASNGTESTAVQPFTITVSLPITAPTIVSAPPPTGGIVGTPYNHTVAAEGTSTITFSAIGLPPGLSISPQGSISGSPTAAGEYNGEITATNGTNPDAVQPFTITIGLVPVAPIITSALPPREATVGTPYSHTVTATGTSPLSFSASGLPPGLTMSPSGTLSGTPTMEGWYNGLIRATNPVDTRLQLITIIVSPPDAGDPPISYFEGDRLVLIPATIQPKAKVSDDKLAPEELDIMWTQTSGPATTINDSDQLVPSVEITQEGTYRFQITVRDGANTSLAEFQLDAYHAPESIPEGTVIPNLQSVQNSFDGLILGWDSEPGKTYIVAHKEDLSDPSWLIIAQRVLSVGSTTYWPDDRVRTTDSGFYGIFQVE